MAKINKSKGFTKSEQYLAQLADSTFLNLWAWPNVYRSIGKELCDLLVVCGNHVIIFSDKTIQWPKNQDTNIAWWRWYKKAIKKSANQVRGAERWISKNPDQIFLDATCKNPLPIKIPPQNTREVYGVVVALGAHDACSSFFAGDSGSFMIKPDIKGDDHLNSSSGNYYPFTIGDIEPSGSFIHVMNDITLDIIMKELDTITDFTDYLKEKAIFARSGNLIYATGEEELLAYYITHMVNENKHGFVHPKNRPWKPTDKLALDVGHYQGILKNPQYLRKKEADKNSYVWDRLIETFTSHMLSGTTITYDNSPFKIADHEIGVRHMAHEPRVMRRLLGNGILDVLQVANKQDRTFKTIVPSPEKPGNGTGYIFMTLAHPKKKLSGGYKQYRQARTNMLQIYCMGVLRKCRYLKRIIGISTEPPPQPNDPTEFSEDMIMIEQPTKWTPKMKAKLDADCKRFDILKEGRVSTGRYNIKEYPSDS